MGPTERSEGGSGWRLAPAREPGGGRDRPCPGTSVLSVARAIFGSTQFHGLAVKSCVKSAVNFTRSPSRAPSMAKSSGLRPADAPAPPLHGRRRVVVRERAERLRGTRDGAATRSYPRTGQLWETLVRDGAGNSARCPAKAFRGLIDEDLEASAPRWPRAVQAVPLRASRCPTKAPVLGA